MVSPRNHPNAPSTQRLKILAQCFQTVFDKTDPGTSNHTTSRRIIKMAKRPVKKSTTEIPKTVLLKTRVRW